MVVGPAKVAVRSGAPSAASSLSQIDTVGAVNRTAANDVHSRFWPLLWVPETLS
jgi:hypothetical protein